MKRDPRTIIDVTQDPGLTQRVITKSITPDIVIPKFHWRPDRLDKRDYIYQLNKPKITTVVDLREHTTPIEDQGALGSCTGQAIAGAIELLNKRAGKQTDVSRLFIYYYERLLLGTVNYDSGAYIRDGIKATNRWGAPLERLWPYQIPKFKTAPSSVAVNDASKRKVTRYERAGNFNAVIDALTSGFPVIVGYYVYSSFMSYAVSKTGFMPYPNTRKETLLGGHAVLLVGYNHNTQRFIARNSWGTNWGDKGYFYMPYNVIKNTNMSSDFWVIKGVNNP